jgi:hypothetical protein
MRADEEAPSLVELTERLGELVVACQELNHQAARDILLKAVREYAPTNGIDDLVWVRKTGTDSPALPDTVVDFPSKPG